MERGSRLVLFMRKYMERNGSAHNGSRTPCKREAYPFLCGTLPRRTVSKFSWKCKKTFSKIVSLIAFTHAILNRFSEKYVLTAFIGIIIDITGRYYYIIILKCTLGEEKLDYQKAAGASKRLSKWRGLVTKACDFLKR